MLMQAYVFGRHAHTDVFAMRETTECALKARETALLEQAREPCIPI